MYLWIEYDPNEECVALPFFDVEEDRLVVTLAVDGFESLFMEGQLQEEVLKYSRNDNQVFEDMTECCWQNGIVMR